MTQPELLPQPEISSQLRTLLKSNRLPSSLLLAGVKGIGKWSVALTLAKQILCENSAATFCGHCASCRQVENFTHPDMFFLFPLPKNEKKAEALYLPYLQQKQATPFSDGSADVASFITIESIRNFITRLSRTPLLARAKIGLIYEAERMLPAAMDCLLKTLEEPPADSYLIVVTAQPRFFPATIISRLRTIAVRPLTRQFISNYLDQRLPGNCKHRDRIINYTKGSLYNIERLINGDYFELRQKAFALFADALRSDPLDFQARHAEDRALSSRDLVEQLCSYWLVFLRDVMLLLASDNEKIAEYLTNSDMLSEYRQLAQKPGSLETIEADLKQLEQIKNQLRRNVNPRMAAFSFLLNLNVRLTA